MGLLDFFFGPPKKDAFAKMYMKALRAAGDQRAMHYDPAEFRIVFEGEGKSGGYANLGNVYADYVAAPRVDRKRCLTTYVRASLSYLKELPEEFADAKPDLRPRLWPRATFEYMRLQSMLEGGSPPDIPSIDIGKHLLLTLVYDLPESVRTLSQEDLDNWGTTFYEALEVAKQNLEEHLGAVMACIGERFYSSASGDTYDATRMILPDFLSKFPVRSGELIAMTPNRDNLFLVGSEDDDGLAIMVTFAERVLNEEPRPMSPFPLRWNGEEWEEWEVPAGHPIHNRLKLLELKYFYTEYEQQKATLDAIHEKNGTDIFVATFSAVEKEGETMSYCVWADGVETYLPQTQKVALVRGEDEDPIFVDWDRVVEVVGHLLQPTDYYPPRFHVQEFPSDEQLQRMA